MQTLKIALIAVALASPALVQAEELKPGQWDTTVSMKMKGMPELSAEDMAAMKQMGIKMPMGGEPIHIQQCITPEQASMKQPVNPSGDQSCTVKNYKHSGNKATGEMVCTGEMNATGKFEMTMNGNTSYSSKMALKGVTKEGQPLDQTTESSGKWVKAKCDAGIAGYKK